MKDAATLTVTVNSFAGGEYEAEIDKECKNAFDKENVSYSYKVKGETTGDYTEFVYVFENGTDLANVETALQSAFDTKTENEWKGSFIDVSFANEEVASVTSNGYALRGVIACVVMAALAFVYVAIRNRWDMGVLVSGSILVSMFLTAALVALCRIPVTNSIAYVIVIFGLISAVMTLFTVNKIRDNKAEATEEEIAQNVALKEIIALSAVTAVGLVALAIAGIIASETLAWFAVAGLVGLLSAIVVNKTVVPFACLSLKKVADAKTANKDKRYVGAKAKEKEQD